jgi:chromosome segregation ATPase
VYALRRGCNRCFCHRATAAAGTSFAVSAAGNSAILVDTRSGQSWLLNQSSDRTRQAVWLPIERLDNAEQVAKWHADEQQREPLLTERANLQLKLAELQARYKEYTSRLGAYTSSSAAALPLATMEKQISELETQLKELQARILKIQ